MTLSKADKQLLKKCRAPKYNPMKKVPKGLLVLDKNGNDFEIRYQLDLGRMDDEASSSLLNQCFCLTEENMKDFYVGSEWGWMPQEKRKELEDANARFLVVFSSTAKAVGDKNVVAAFVHFRFDVDDEDNPTQICVYVYELQVAQEFQRQHGIGRRLMEIVEAITISSNFGKVMLTVFHANVGAMTFYKRLGYQVDATSPSEYGGEECDYEILCKVLTGKK